MPTPKIAGDELCKLEDSRTGYIRGSGHRGSGLVYAALQIDLTIQIPDQSAWLPWRQPEPIMPL